MRHQKRGRKLGRDSAHRKSLYANLTAELIQHGRIRTTLAKAKEVRPVAEQMITLGKRGDLHARRQAVAFLRQKPVVKSLFDDIAPRYAERPRRTADGPSASDAGTRPPGGARGGRRACRA